MKSFPIALELKDKSSPKSPFCEIVKGVIYAIRDVTLLSKINQEFPSELPKDVLIKAIAEAYRKMLHITKLKPLLSNYLDAAHSNHVELIRLLATESEERSEDILTEKIQIIEQQIIMHALIQNGIDVLVQEGRTELKTIYQTRFPHGV